jgi:hypothetical protein
MSTARIVRSSSQFDWTSPTVIGLAIRGAAPRLLLGIVDQVQFTWRSTLGSEDRRRLCSVLGPVVDDVYQHHPDGHPVVNVLDDFVRQGRQPGIDRDPFGLPAFAHLIDRWQRFEFRLGSFIGALCLEPDAPTLGGTEMMDEDAAQAALANLVRPRPHC